MGQMAPLPNAAGGWHGRILSIASTCGEVGSKAHVEHCVGELYDALRSAPDCAGVNLPPRSYLDKLLAAGAYESAVLSFLTDGVGLMLSKGPNGVAMASIVLPGREEEITSEGPSLALALVSAVALSVCDTQRR